MTRLREFGLNSLLAVLVLLSVVLSARVWFPPDQISLFRTNQAQVQPTPPSMGDPMPEVLRPERILVRLPDGRAAQLLPGSDEFSRAWEMAKERLTGLRPLATPVLDQSPEPAELEAITLMLPLARAMVDWAHDWNWSTEGLNTVSLEVDRVQFRLSPDPAIYLSGPGGETYRLDNIAPADEVLLRNLIGRIDPQAFLNYRPLEPVDPALRLRPGILVPEVAAMRTTSVHARMPEFSAEEARYFPDLSVVRQITEQDARSFTDGQRLLRLAASGILEYRTAQLEGSAPDYERASDWTREWVGARGGWPQELVLSWYLKRPHKTILIYELRRGGPFPVETAGGALWVEVTTGPENSNTERITYVKRYPVLTILFDRTTRSIISPEEALDTALDQFPQLLLWEEVRGMHLAYLARTTGDPAQGEWILDPSWVVQVGEDRLYIPAVPGSASQPTMARPVE